MSFKVFISHHSSDLEYAQQLADALEGLGDSPWLAAREVGLGEFYAEEIVPAIEQSDALVLLFSAASAESKHVRNEVELAASTGLKLLVFRLEELDPERGLKYFLRSSQWRDAWDLAPEQAAKIVYESLRRRKPDPPRPFVPPRPPRNQKSRRGIWAVAVVLLILGSLIAWAVFSRQYSRLSLRPGPGGGLEVDRPIPLVQSAIFTLLEEGAPPEPEWPAPPPEMRVQLFSRARDSDTPFQLINDGFSLRSRKDEYFLSIETRTPGFLYVFQLDSWGYIDWLYPENRRSGALSGGEATVQEGIQIRIPTGTGGYFLDDFTGFEHIYVVLSATRWEALEAALDAPPDLTRGVSGVLPLRISAPLENRTRAVGGVTQGKENLPSQVGAEVFTGDEWFRAEQHFMYVARYLRHI